MVWRRLKGFTLIEIMVALAIFSLLFAGFAAVLNNANHSWQIGTNKLLEEQQARRAMDAITGLLRQGNPDWVVDGSHYAVTITGNQRIDFYRPVFNSSGIVTSLRKITFKLDPDDSTQLLVKEGTAAERIVATALQAFNIKCGCAGCTSVDQNCPRVNVTVVTRKNTTYNVTSDVTLRNGNMSVPDEVVVEEPAQGEF